MPDPVLPSRPRFVPQPISDSDSDSESEPDAAVPSAAPSAGRAGDADSDAETVEPDSDAETVEPERVEPERVEPFNAAFDAGNESDASTLPPERVVPEVVEIDFAGIDELEATVEREMEREAGLWARGEYPLLEKASVLFGGGDDADSCPALVLSDRAATGGGAVAGVGVLPPRVNRFLSPYQRDGVTFLYRLWERGRGGLLADAMGLGKTVQILCLLGAACGIWDRDARRAEGEAAVGSRILVVVPAAVSANWVKEFAVWTPFSVQVYDSSREASIGRALATNELDVVIAGETSARDCMNFFSNPTDGVVRNWAWNIMVVDEIHNAKNLNTGLYAALKKMPAKIKFGLTGTAVQNKLKELWAIMSIVVPPTLWPSLAEFKADYIKVINGGTKRDASSYQRRLANERIDSLRQRLSKHFIRRPKKTISDQLPGKTDYLVLMKMKKDGLQGEMYERFQSSYDVEMLRDAKKMCDCGEGIEAQKCCHRYPSTPLERANAPLWMIQHPNEKPCEKCPFCICFRVTHVGKWLSGHALVIVPEDDETDRVKIEERKSLFRYYLGPKNIRKADVALAVLERSRDVSCKLNVALKLLEEFGKKGHKTIIFYESLRLGTILQRWATFNSVAFQVIDGSVAKEARQVAVDKFNRDAVYKVFMISKRAGGTGLNISTADRVLIFEPCWNPTLDLQAQDRAHRLGQKNSVHVYRFVVENTVEHYIMKTGIKKSQLSNAILDNTAENWHIAGNEVGSMAAMLTMGDVFAKNQADADRYQVIPVDQQNATPDDVDSESGVTECVNNVNDRFALKYDTLLEGVGGSTAEDNILAENGISLLGDEFNPLDVDLDGGDNEWAVGGGAVRDNRFVGLKAGSDIGDNGPDELNDAAPAPVIMDSQMDTDIILHDEGAASKIVMTSTSARRRARQVLGQERDVGGGINANGPDGMNFDDGAWVQVARDLPPGFDSISDDDEPEPKVQRETKLSRRPTQNPVRKKLKPKVGSEVDEAAGSEPVRKKRKSSKKDTKTSAQPPKVTSVFSAKSRLRR